MSIGSASFVLTSAFDDPQIKASVARLNESVAASVKDVRIGAQVDQAKLTSVLADAQARIAKTQANVKIGADVKSTAIDAAVAKANAQIAALSEKGGTDAGDAMNSGWRSVAFSPAVIGAAVAAGLIVLPGLMAVAGAAGAVALGAAFAVRGSAELQAQGKSLVSGLESTLESAASVLVKPLESAFSALAGELPTLKSLLTTTFSDVAPLIKPIAGFFTTLVNGALPGFNSLLRQAQGPLEQFFTASGKIVGSGLGTFFADLGPGAAGSLEGIEVLEKGALILAADLAKVAAGIGEIIQLGKQLTTVNPQLAATGKALGIPDANKNIFQAAGDAFGWLEKHLPAGNKTLLDVASGEDKVGSSAGSMGSAVAAAAPKVGTLSGDMGILSSKTADATSKTQAFDDAWQQFVGKTATDQTAVLNVAQAFDSYNKSVKTSGTNTIASRQAFENIITSMGSGLSILNSSGASVDQLNKFYQTNIEKLGNLKGLLPDEQKQVQGVTKDYDAWAASTDGLDAATATAAGTIGSQLEGQLSLMHVNVPRASADTTAFADSILKTGDQSSATHGARQTLINDLIQAGVSSSTAKQLVATLQTQIDGLRGKNVTVGANVAGAEAGVRTFAGLVDAIPRSVAVQITAEVQGANLNQIATALTGMSSGGLVGGIPHAARGLVAGSGPTGRDSQLILAAPGELVIPASHAAQFGAAARRAGIPGLNGTVARTEPEFGKLGSQTYRTAISDGQVPATAPAQAGMPGMTQYQGAEIIRRLDQQAKAAERLPYELARALSGQTGAGTSRGWFQTGG